MNSRFLLPHIRVGFVVILRFDNNFVTVTNRLSVSMHLYNLKKLLEFKGLYKRSYQKESTRMVLPLMVSFFSMPFSLKKGALRQLGLS